MENKIINSIDVKKDGVHQPQLTSLEIILTSKCNERCIHCYIPNQKKDAATTLGKDQIKDVIRQFREMNGSKINFSGGEPLLHPDIWELLEYCTQQDIKVSLNSNMLLLTQEIVKRLKALSLFYIQVSLYSMNPDIHDTITNRKGSFNRTRSSIELLVENGITVTLSCPVMKENCESVSAIQTYAAKLGIDCYFDPIMMAQSNGDTKNLRNCLTPAETKRVIKQMILGNSVFMDAIRLAPSHEDLLKLKFAHRWSSCSIMSSSLCLDADGTLYPCPGWNSMILANVKETTLKQVWTSSKLAKRLRVVNQYEFPKCKSCNLHNFCEMCVVYNVNENGNIDDVCSRFCVAAAMRKAVVEELYIENKQKEL